MLQRFHQRYGHDYQKDAAIWKKVTDVTGFAKTDAKHKEMLKRIFEKGTLGKN